MSIQNYDLSQTLMNLVQFFLKQSNIQLENLCLPLYIKCHIFFENLGGGELDLGEAVADPGFQIRGGPGQVHSLNSKNIYTKFSKYFYKNNAEIKTQYNCSVIQVLKFQNCTVQISHKSYAGSSLRGFISSIRLGFLTTS